MRDRSIDINSAVMENFEPTELIFFNLSQPITSFAAQEENKTREPNEVVI